MDRLTAEQVLFIHDRLIEETGGSHGIRDFGQLQSAESRTAATFDKNGLYPGLFTKAAVLMHSVIKNHPFIDGNKRTAITSASIFILRSGHTLTASNSELERFTLKVAADKVDVEEIAVWFEEFSVK